MKKRLLAGMIAVMTLSGVSASANKNAQPVQADGERDTRIIVEVDKSAKNLTDEEIFASQDQLLAKIARRVTSNYELVKRYSVLNNAFVVEVNSEDVEAIKALDGVASVTVDKVHAKQSLDDGNYYSAKFVRPDAVDGEDSGAFVDNISAATMNKSSDTNDGEGTVIAILDNEFYLRGEHTPDLENEDDGSAWNHAVYKPLAAGVAQKFTFDNLTDTIASKNFHGKREEGKEPGQEGSMYFNTKVPYYYDYGGESDSYGKVGQHDFDTSSLLTYHGSHVASIASANADTYKGIAPKAQLACMKVFTTYIADKTGEQMGFGTSTGAYDSAILEAIEDAILLGVDGINMSLGSDLDDFDSDSITMKTLQSLANNSGILSAISAGNAGKMSYSFTGGYGNWTTDMVETGVLGSYANSTDNMIIASAQPTEIYYERAFQLLDSEGAVIKNVSYEDQIVNREGLAKDYDDNAQRWMTDIITDDEGVIDLTQKVEWQYIGGFGSPADYTDIDVKGKVAVVNRGSTSFADKYSTAVNKGAVGLVIINNDPTATDFNFRCSFGDDFQSKIPCALALYRDKPTFESNQKGEFLFVSKQVSSNDAARTISSYSSDGARFDYSLKPDITTPGENIRGAVPPQKKEHRDETPYSTYEYLSGTSMAAPNYAGAQSVVLSRKAKDVYADGNATTVELASLDEYRRTVDLRLMSTAKPMLDAKANPETDVINYTSPRMQGAGMVDLGKAYETNIYLDGLDANENRINKSKINLGNNEDIARGDIKLSFAAINESNSTETYTAKVTVMRPAIESNNKVISKDYTNKGEVDSLEKIPGLTYVIDDSENHQPITKVVTNNGVGYKKNDVIKVTKVLEYFTEKQNFNTLAEYDKTVGLKKFEQGYYYNSAETGCKWEPLPDYDYQSIQDVVIDTFERSVIIPANDETVIDMDAYSLAEDVKNDILAKFPYGCAIEGFVELQQGGETKLSMPYLGFYSGLDKDDANTLENAPVVEPFEFEKDPSLIYPSDLVNDVTKQLVGKSSVDFGSSWTVGYAETTMDVDTDPVLVNDASFASLAGFHRIGINPANNEYFDNPGDNLYVGNPEKSNTMIIHQFVMRSVKDNFFTIKNSDGEVVYKSALTDMLFGDKQLYKSHVDANYLSAGYVAHRASAIIPLYDINTHKAFADGTYEIEFNYQLAYNSSWVSKKYNFIIDSTPAEVTSITEYKDQSGVDKVRIEVNESKLCKAVVCGAVANYTYDETKGVYVIEQTKEALIKSMKGLNYEKGEKKLRLFISLTDSAYGVTTVIVHFFGNTFSNNVICSGSSFTNSTDFVKDGNTVKFYKIQNGTKTEIFPTEYITIKTTVVDDSPLPPEVHEHDYEYIEEVEATTEEEGVKEHYLCEECGKLFILNDDDEYVEVTEAQLIIPKIVEDDDDDNKEKEEKTNGCGGSIVTASSLITVISLAGVGLLSIKKRKDEKEAE